MLVARALFALVALSGCARAGGYYLDLSWQGGFVKPLAGQGAPEVVVLEDGSVLVLRDNDYYRVDYPPPDEKLVREALRVKFVPHRLTPDAPEGVIKVKLDGAWHEVRVTVGPAPKPVEDLLGYLTRAKGAKVLEGPVVPQGLVLKVAPYEARDAEPWTFSKPLREDTLWGEEAKALREYLKDKAYYLAPNAGLFKTPEGSFKVWVVPIFEK